MSPSTDITPLLAGVCSRFASMLHFNVWALRAVFIILLLAKTVLAVIVYGILALLFHAVGRYRGQQAADHDQAGGAVSRPTAYSERISDLDRRFREWEQSLRK